MPHSNGLTPLLASRIASGGPIPFPAFMTEALYHPELGYYRSTTPRTGRSGDFYTSVDVGSLFGRLLARQFHEVWKRLAQPDPFTLVEQGANDGKLLRDVLQALHDFAPDCFGATRGILVEPFPDLERRQRQTLSRLPHVDWVPAAEELPPFDGIHFSNELLDAFPFHRIQWTGQLWQELGVGFSDDRFCWVPLDEPHPDLTGALRALPNLLPGGYTTEIRTSVTPWIAEVASKLRSGAVFVIDYGHPRHELYRPERTGGTATAYRGHTRLPDLLSDPGSQDLTAHVDFTTLVEAAERNGLLLHGFCDQSRFLTGLAPLHFTDSTHMLPETEKELRAFKTLFHPGILGTSFKALCLAKLPDTEPLSGFRFDRRPREKLGLATELA